MEEKSVLKRQYTDEVKTEAARLGQSVGQHEAARRLGVPIATLGNWVRKQHEAKQVLQVDAGNGAAALPRRPVSEIDAKNSRLRKELASAKLDIEILRKATAYFAKESR